MKEIGDVLFSLFNIIYNFHNEWEKKMSSLCFPEDGGQETAMDWFSSQSVVTEKPDYTS